MNRNQFIHVYQKQQTEYPKDRSRHGLEKETIRTTNQKISTFPHPDFLGSPLKNPYITLDFSEAQLELVTPNYPSLKQPLNFLNNLHHFFYHFTTEETLWPSSMPPKLPLHEEEIPIANFGSSESGKQKKIYRIGLAHRYGRRMQTISSLHYNFSLPKSFWQIYYQNSESLESFTNFISNSYLHIVRNFLREGWIISYLFGGSPACHQSYMDKVPDDFHKVGQDTLYLPYATSIRMSYLGYYSKVQEQLSISYNHIEQYILDLESALQGINSKYQKMGIFQDGLQIQMNDHHLQIENEHYARIRPKGGASALTSLESIKKNGIEYLEIRSLDLNPFLPLGVDQETLNFLHCFLVYCLSKASPPIDHLESQKLCRNQNLIGLRGRDPHLTLENETESIHPNVWANKIIHEMEELAFELQEKNWLASIQHVKQALSNKQLLSATILEEMKKNQDNFLTYHTRLAKEHKQLLLTHSDFLATKKLAKIANVSLAAQNALEERENMQRLGYQQLELSTQILIQDALKRDIHVEVLDPKSSFIRLTKNAHIEYIMQATRTAKDSYISALITGNKQVTKLILHEHGISTPKGKSFSTAQEAISHYPTYKNSKVVVKPTNTNFGEGISFVKKNHQEMFEKAVEHAFTHDNTIIVEEYISGSEYRFLIIGEKCVAILQREPANIVGDGKHTISELIEMKNHSPKSYVRERKDLIKLGEVERKMLQTQNFSPDSIPAEEEKIYLRQNSNISTGGDAIDMTDEMPADYRRIAEQAAAACDAKISGVDMIIKDIGKQQPTTNDYSVIEVNYNPAIAMHRYPDYGMPRNVAGSILDFLGF
jgi:glutamate--cysteine ligase